MAKFWQSTKFASLKSEWNKKLEESGFDDAEKEVDGERVLKKITVTEGKWGGILRHLPGNNREVEYQERADYFSLLSQKLFQETEFEDDLDRLIMERTAEGKSIKEISEELKNKLQPGQIRSKHNRDTIRYVRRRYEHRWGIRTWSQYNMTSRKTKPPTP